MSEKTYVNRYFQGETEDDSNIENREFAVLEREPFEKVKLVDAVAAGGAWWCLSPMDGEHAGKKLWFEDCANGECEWVYHSGKTDDDGFVFNGNDSDTGSQVPGDSVPELDGVEITLCTPEYYAEFVETMRIEALDPIELMQDKLSKGRVN
jgi:hypothetical protein